MNWMLFVCEYKTFIVMVIYYYRIKIVNYQTSCVCVETGQVLL